MADVTPEERQRVAERLRKLGSGGYAQLADTVEIVTGNWRTGANDFALALADLIDPTCENVTKADDMNNGIAQFRCSACGCEIGGPDAAEGHRDGCCIVDHVGHSCGYVGVSYCPRCGARVTRKGETNG